LEKKTASDVWRMRIGYVISQRARQQSCPTSFPQCLAY
jgi:hypothetical protein